MVEAVLAIISSILGAGIVSIPYALTTTGMVTGIYINIGVIMILIFATHLYVAAMEYLKLTSISELCFMSMGRSSIYLVNGLFMAIFFGALILYNVLFSNVAVQLFNKSGLE